MREPIEIDRALSGGELQELLNASFGSFNRQIILAPVRHNLSMFRPPFSPSRFSPGAAGGSPLA